MIRWLCLAAALLAAAPAARAEALGQVHDITLSFAPESGRLAAVDRIAVAAPGTLTFRLAPWIEEIEVSAGGTNRVLRNAGAPWRLGVERELVVRYAGVLPPADPAASRDSAELGHSPEGSALAAGSGWLPVTDEAWAGYRLAVEVPLPHRAVATGTLTQEDDSDGSYRAVFEAERPVEPPSLFIGPYLVEERRAGALRLRTWFHPEAAGLAVAYLDAAESYLARYAALIGDYPFADYQLVSAPFPVGLGFPGLMYASRDILPLPFMRGRSLAHEVLHNWWGNGVLVDYAGGNWCEGLTTYQADYALAAEAGPEAAHEMRLGWLRDYAALPAERDQPVTRFVTREHDAAQIVGYGKVAFIFHMLEREIGEAAFDAALSALWRSHRFRAAGWADLQGTFERAAGRGLGWFFEQWLARTGAPRLSLGEAARSGGGSAWQLTLTLLQEDPAYRLSVPLRLRTAEGWRDLTVELETNAEVLEVALEAEPLELAVDPGHDLFRRLLPGESPPILRDVTLSAATRAVADSPRSDYRDAAEDVAAALLGDAMLTAEADLPEAVPLLLIAPPSQAPDLLRRLGIAAAPALPDGKAEALAGRAAGGQPYVLVTAEDAETLRGLARRLPHYGGKSYVVFTDGRGVEAGLLPVPDSPLSRRLGEPD